MNLSLTDKLPLALLFCATLVAPAAAQNLTQFQNGQVADANAVNANFSAVKSAADQAGTAAAAAQATADAAQASVTTLSGSVGGLTSAFSVTNQQVGINRRLQFPVGTANRKVVLFPFADNDHQFLGFGVNNGTLRYQVDDVGASHVFFAGTSPSASNELMRIQGDGRVGIGTSSPEGRLHLDGSGTSGVLLRMVSGAGPMMKLGSGSGQEWDVFAGAADFAISRSGIDFPFIIRSDTGGVSIGNGGTVTAGFKLEVGGNIRCVNLTQTSSRELKTDVEPLAGALDTLMRLRSVSYVWNEAAPEQVRGERDIGFIADEVDAVLPEVVAKDENGRAVGIAYGKITPVTVGAIQELKQANDRLVADNDALRARVEALEQAFAELRPLLAGRK